MKNCKFHQSTLLIRMMMLSTLLILFLNIIPSNALDHAEEDELPPPTGTVINVSDVPGLLDAISQANETGNVDIILEDGTYEFDTEYVSWIKWGLLLGNDNITIRSKSGNRDNVIIRGKGMDGNIASIFIIGGDNITIANVTMGWVTTHAIQVKGELDADNFIAHNVRFVDTYQQMLKVTYDNNTPDITGDNGIVRYCLFEYSAGVGPQWYIGGIDCHAGKNWHVKENVFRDIVSPEDNLAEHAIHFWSGADSTVAERNLITNCDRGIGFGLGDRGHGAGMIVNNMVHTTRDVGIGLENANGVKVYNNTVVSENYPFSIEYRFSGTNAIIKNNLCNASVELRNEASGELASNIEDFSVEGFVNYSEGDLHLMKNWTNLRLVVDEGENLTDVTVDFDGEMRPAWRGFDIGADEYTIKVTGIHLYPKFLYLKPSFTFDLKARVFPYYASNKNVEWSTSDSSVVSVDENGEVQALSPGFAQITATTEDGGFSDKCFVRVSAWYHRRGTKMNDHVKVYPVPFRRGDLNIELGDEGIQSRILVHTSNEQLIFETETDADKIELPRSDFREGIYIISIYQGNETIRKKVLVR